MTTKHFMVFFMATISIFWIFNTVWKNWFGFIGRLKNQPIIWGQMIHWSPKNCLEMKVMSDVLKFKFFFKIQIIFISLRIKGTIHIWIWLREANAPQWQIKWISVIQWQSSMFSIFCSYNQHILEDCKVINWYLNTYLKWIDLISFGW